MVWYNIFISRDDVFPLCEVIMILIFLDHIAPRWLVRKTPWLFWIFFPDVNYYNDVNFKRGKKCRKSHTWITARLCKHILVLNCWTNRMALIRPSRLSTWKYRKVHACGNHHYKKRCDSHNISYDGGAFIAHNNTQQHQQQREQDI